MKIIIDCDPGNGVPGANVDDGLAIALAVAAPGHIDIEAITIVAGNTPSRTGFVAAQELLRRFGADVPVYLGAERPLVEDPRRWRDHLDQAGTNPDVVQLWKGTDPLPSFTSAPTTPAAEAIGRAVTEAPGEVTLVAIGPLTNIALALRLYPNLASDVCRIVIMGGVFDVDGYLVDTNFGFDPEAAAIVVSSGAPITLVPMDVTTRTMLTHQDLDQLELLGTPLANALLPTLRPWVTHSSSTRGIPGMWIHDVVTIALLIDPSLGFTQRQAVRVDLAPGPSRGRTARWTPGALKTRVLPRFAEPPAIDVLMDIDNERLLHLITTFIGRSSSSDINEEKLAPNSPLST